MARKVKDSSIDTREARSKLKPRGKPYWRTIEQGMHLGYRRLKGKPGTWWVRHYIGNQDYDVESIGAADDLSDADGVAILDYWQAQTKARERMVARAHSAVGKTAPLTVGDAMDAYLDYIENRRKSLPDAQSRDRLYIRPALGDIEINALTAEKLRKWHEGLAKTARHVRTGRGKDVKKTATKSPNTEEAVRARRANANRTLTTLKAALNRIWKDGKATSDSAWRRVKPFEGVDSARDRYLNIPEAKRLINACDPNFRLLVQAALQTGARYQELARLEAKDFNGDSNTIAIRKSKSDKPRHVVLTEEGAALFKQLSIGKAGGQLLLEKSPGISWSPSDQSRPMKKACANAKIDPPIGIHGMRHTWASHSVMNGVPLLVVAKNLGHRDTRMVEKHYGHLAPSYSADAIRAGAPRFGFKADKKITALARA